MTFKLSKGQLVKRVTLAAELRAKAAALNVAIASFNREIGPPCRRRTLKTARALATTIAETAQAQFDAKSERWQDGETDTMVRYWIEHWQMSLDEVDLALPESLEELDPETHAAEIDDAPTTPGELERMLRPRDDRAARG
jgi:hypothetical protein